MNTSLSWLKAYVPDLDVTAQEYMDAMTLSGTKVEGYTQPDADLEKIVVGEILSVEKHPDADKLVVCQVNVGEETVQIVTGAPNITENSTGALVPVVLPGGRVAGGHEGKPVPGGIAIEAGMLRGVKSDGMMCSIEELGSNTDMYPKAPDYGIYIFDDDDHVKAGDDAIEALGLHDTVVEYEITSNRVDCYSVIGIAREAAATFRKTFVPPAIPQTGNDEDVNDYIKVTVEDPVLCPRYTARIVKNIHIAPSPEWMQRALRSVGIRPINNLVDITNYVMEEYGQPMHAYDYDQLSGHEIIVRRAKDGEKFVTLDGQERTMDHDVVMICDGEKAVGIGGIMGGENSMITDDVKTMMFEAACFDGTNIRLSAKRIGLRTDASGKFEKGLDPNNALEAMNRACALVEEMGAGEVVGGVVDIYPVKREGETLPFEPEKYNALLGTDVAPEIMLQYFERIGLQYNPAAETIYVPTFRQDLHCTADMAEEVARFYGYDKIPTTLPGGASKVGRQTHKLRIQDAVAVAAESFGFSQAMTFSFESPKVFDRLLLAADAPERRAITISNPLGEDYSIMRTVPLNGLLTSLAVNYNHRNKVAALYELATVYLPKELPMTQLPDERVQLVMGIYGEGDFYYMKGVIEGMLVKLGMFSETSYDPAAAKSFLHPGRQANVLYEGEVIGYLGELHPQVADNYGIGSRVNLAVLDVPKIVEKASYDRKYEGFAKYPAVTRDISLVVPKEILSGQIVDCVRANGGEYLEHVELFDLYEGAQIAGGYKSMAYTVRFRAKDRTLEENDITPVMKQILIGLEAMNIRLRR